MQVMCSFSVTVLGQEVLYPDLYRAIILLIVAPVSVFILCAADHASNQKNGMQNVA